jgi:hypothetical protein
MPHGSAMGVPGLSWTLLQNGAMKRWGEDYGQTRCWLRQAQPGAHAPLNEPVESMYRVMYNHPIKVL